MYYSVTRDKLHINIHDRHSLHGWFEIKGRVKYCFLDMTEQN